MHNSKEKVWKINVKTYSLTYNEHSTKLRNNNKSGICYIGLQYSGIVIAYYCVF